MAAIPEVEHRVKATHMDNIGLIKDDANSLMLHGSQLSISSGMTHFDRPFIFVDHVNRMILDGNVDTGSQWVELFSIVGYKGDTRTSTLASTSTFPLHPPVLDMVIIS